MQPSPGVYLKYPESIYMPVINIHYVDWQCRDVFYLWQTILDLVIICIVKPDFQTTWHWQMFFSIMHNNYRVVIPYSYIKLQLDIGGHVFCRIVTEYGFHFIDDFSNTIIFLQNVVPTGIVISEEKLFCILANQQQECIYRPCFYLIKSKNRNVCIGHSKDDFCKVWLQMAQ